MKHLKHCETSRNTLTLVIRCDDIGARRGDVGARRGDVADRHGDVADRQGDVADRQGDVADRHGDVGDRAELTVISARSFRRLWSWHNSADV